MKRRRCKPVEPKFTTDEKINWIFKYLIKELKPEVVASVNRPQKFKVDGITKIMNIQYYPCKCEVETLPEKIPYPFDDMIVILKDRKVKIIGPNVYYKFPLAFLTIIYSRIKT